MANEVSGGEDGGSYRSSRGPSPLNRRPRKLKDWMHWYYIFLDSLLLPQIGSSGTVSQKHLVSGVCKPGRHLISTKSNPDQIMCESSGVVYHTLTRTHLLPVCCILVGPKCWLKESIDGEKSIHALLLLGEKSRNPSV